MSQAPAPTPDPAATIVAPARPAPTRAAVLAAYHGAVGGAAAAPTAAPAAIAAAAPVAAVGPAPVAAPAVLARSVAVPAPAPAFTPSPFSSVTPLSRVETAVSSVAPEMNGRPAAPEPIDFDALAEHVLERLRHELRDGRERLGFLLDDSR